MRVIMRHIYIDMKTVQIKKRKRKKNKENLRGAWNVFKEEKNKTNERK